MSALDAKYIRQLLATHKLVRKKPPAPPVGYTKEKNKKVWNWGFVFSFYKGKWRYRHQTVVLRPFETIEEAKQRENIDAAFSIFFLKG